MEGTAESRMTSASRRNRDCRASQRFRGSRSTRSARARELCRYVADITIERWMDFIEKSRTTSSRASHSRRSGYDGSAPRMPKSFSVSTRPRPKKRYHHRFTVTRCTSALSGCTSQRARSSRVFGVASAAKWFIAFGNPGTTASPGSRKLPRRKTCVTRGFVRDQRAPGVAPCLRNFRLGSRSVDKADPETSEHVIPTVILQELQLDIEL